MNASKTMFHPLLCARCWENKTHHPTTRSLVSVKPPQCLAWHRSMVLQQPALQLKDFVSLQIPCSWVPYFRSQWEHQLSFSIAFPWPFFSSFPLMLPGGSFAGAFRQISPLSHPLLTPSPYCSQKDLSQTMLWVYHSLIIKLPTGFSVCLGEMKPNPLSGLQHLLFLHPSDFSSLVFPCFPHHPSSIIQAPAILNFLQFLILCPPLILCTCSSFFLQRLLSFLSPLSPLPANASSFSGF